MSADDVECPIYGPDKTFHIIVRMQPPSWISLKGKKKFQLSQILTDAYEKRHRPICTKVRRWIFQFRLCLAARANRKQWRIRRFDVSSYLRNSLVKQNQI